MGINNTTLSDTFSLRGEWWLPDSPDRKVTGKIAFSPEGPAELELEGSLAELSGPIPRKFAPPIILGMTYDGRCCTVMDSFESRFQLHASGQATSRINYNRLLIGDDFVTSPNMELELAIVEFAELSEWINKLGYEFSPLNDEVLFKYKRPEPISIRIDSLTTEFSFHSGLDQERRSGKYIFSPRELMQIKPDQPQCLDWYLDVIFKFRIFLSLLIGEPSEIVLIRFIIGKRSEAHHKGSDTAYVDLCMRIKLKKKDSELSLPEIPFPYPIIMNNFPKILNNLYSKANLLKTTYSLYFGVQVNAQTAIDFQFLALFQALESYHRAEGKDKYVSEKEYESVMAQLIKAIPADVREDFREALKSRIKYGNQYSLRKRLDLILARVPDTLVKIFTDNDNEFISKVVTTRHYLVHRDETDKQNVMDVKGMFNACESLKLIIIYLLLSECGIDKIIIGDVMGEHDKFRNRPRIR